MRQFQSIHLEEPENRTLLLFVAILLTACGPASQSLANSWQEALNKGDIDAALSYLAEDAVVTIKPAGPEGDAVFTGHAEIRGWYETLTAQRRHYPEQLQSGWRDHHLP
jgi:ketosteroid isomerase-like protein